MILPRLEGEELRITIQPGADLHSLLRDGITVRVNQIDRKRARIEIDAPKSVRVDRAEVAD